MGIHPTLQSLGYPSNPAHRQFLADSVDNVIKFLDRVYPEGWRHRINWEELDMSSETKCIGGQLEGSHTAFVQKWNCPKKNEYAGILLELMIGDWEVEWEKHK